MRRLVAATCVLAVLSSACSDSGDATTTAGDEPAATAVTSAIDRQQIERFAAQMDYLREQLRIPAMSVAVVEDQQLV